MARRTKEGDECILVSLLDTFVVQLGVRLLSQYIMANKGALQYLLILIICIVPRSSIVKQQPKAADYYTTTINYTNYQTDCIIL
jgi:hypothetical protein